MLQALSNRIITGVITLSMMLLSGYEGNQASFAEIFASYAGNKIFVSATLYNAFENDFEEIFKSGQRIDIHFMVQIHEELKILHEETFRHSVVYDPLAKVYTVFLEEKNQQTTAADFQQLKEIISQVEYTYNSVKYNGGHIVLSAELPKIRLQSIQKEYDLMMLWKFKKPKVQTVCSMQESEFR